MSDLPAPNGRSAFILYRTEDGDAEINLRAQDGTVWLTQLEIAELFATTKQNVSLHANNILKEGELSGNAVVKDSLTTAADGKHYKTKFFSLPMILAIEQAELRVKERKQLTLDYWRGNVNRLLEFNDKPLLQGVGSIGHEAMKAIAHQRFDAFAAKRRTAEAIAADAEDLEALEQLEHELEKKGGRI